MFRVSTAVAAPVLVAVTLYGCGDNGGNDGSAGGALHVCAALENFQPDKIFESTSTTPFFGFCDVPSPSKNDQGACVEKECHFMEGLGCACQTKTLCEGALGTWTEFKCKDMLAFLDIEENVTKVLGGETCDQFEFSLGNYPGHDSDAFSGDLRLAVSFLAGSCCSNAPADLCQKDAKLLSPCAAEADFEGESMAPSTCIPFGQHTTEEECAAVGGEFVRKTCKEEASSFASWLYLPLAEAHEAGSCGNLSVDPRGELTRQVDRYARSCCSTFPATLCREVGDWTASQCASPDRFKPDAVISGEETCADWVTELPHDVYDAIVDARDKQAVGASRPCEGSNVSGFPLEDYLLNADLCCSDYPNTLCQQPEPPAPVCSSADKFLPNKTFETFALPKHPFVGFCEWTGAPPANESACSTVGCRWNEMCVCETEALCDGVGTWQEFTCAGIIDFMGLRENLTSAANGEACESFAYEYPFAGTEFEHMDLRFAVSLLAGTCCTDSPANMCQPQAPLLTPCAGDDFIPENVARSECVGLDTDAQDTCEEAGGLWLERLCKDEMSGLASIFYLALAEAAAQQTCSGITVDFGGQTNIDLEKLVQMFAQHCCRNFPAKTICSSFVVGNQKTTF